MSQSREQFEACYPVPTGVQWVEESSRYALVEIKTARHAGSTIAGYEAYVHSWSVWKASREAVVVQLPKIDPREWACTQDECLAIQQGIDMSKRKIEAAGLRCEVKA